MDRRQFLSLLIPAAKPKIAKSQTEKIRLRGTNYEVTTQTIKGELEPGMILATPMRQCEVCSVAMVDDQGKDWKQDWRVK